MFSRVRNQDILLLKKFNVGFIVDLMVEKKKVKYGLKWVRETMRVVSFVRPSIVRSSVLEWTGLHVIDLIEMNILTHFDCRYDY